MPYDFENSKGWDCDPLAQLALDTDDGDERDDQCLDRAASEWEW